MEILTIIVGAVIAVEGVFVIYYSQKILENILRNPEISLRMFFLKDEAPQAFKVYGIFMSIYGILGSISGIIILLRPEVLPPNILDNIPPAIGSISLIGLIYLLKVISGVTDSS